MPANPLKNYKPKGTLVTTLYEHKNPVNTITVCDDQSHFLTGSRNDQTVHIWRTDEIEREVKARSADSISVPGSVNKIDMLLNSNSLAVGSSGGLHVYDLNRLKSEGRKISSEEEVTQVSNFMLPISNQHVIAYITHNGGFHLHDVRSRANILD